MKAPGIYPETQINELNVELTVLKIVTRFSPLWSHFSFSMGPVDPRVVTILVRTIRKLLRTNTSTM